MNSINLDLEALLQKAASVPEFRTEFYKKLLSEKLIVITRKDDHSADARTLQPGENVKILSLANGMVPVFTSADRIFDKGIVKEQVNILEIKGADLFALTKGGTLVLNPYSDYGKELMPDEIESLLTGTIFHTMSQAISVQNNTTVKIAQPAIYPVEIIDSIIAIYKKEPSVQAAYLAWIHVPGTGEPPHYIVSVDADGDIKEINRKAGTTAQQYFKKDEFIDFIKFDTKGGLSDYFKTIAPFYKK